MLAAHCLFAEWLSGQLSAVAQGALWTAYRLKGESVEELLGFVRATEDSLAPLPSPPGIRPVVFPSYNGARRHANLLPLLALLLARQGVPVLIHGTYGSIADETDLDLPQHDPKARIATGHILTHLGFPAAPIGTLFATNFSTIT
jgi:anthranilate phosphoribosyltransferase